MNSSVPALSTYFFIIKSSSTKDSCDQTPKWFEDSSVNDSQNLRVGKTLGQHALDMTILPIHNAPWPRLILPGDKLFSESLL
jgi:hypothetical protein